MNTQTSTSRRRDEDADTFWRKLVLPQEERMRLGIPWYGGYRWFKSPNVVPIEKYRKPKGHGAGIGGE
jgi:hypothetical protein